MGKTYDRCPDEVAQRAQALIEKWHPHLKAAEVKIDYLFVSTDGEGPALTCHGWPAAAVVRVIGLKDRVAGRADAEIVIARDQYTDSPAAQQDALLDHELTHLEVVVDSDGAYAIDDHYRPKLKLKKHDYQFGWFTSIARRHGEASYEVRQARQMYDQDGHSLFAFMEEA